jgi:hypothetical protein
MAWSVRWALDAIFRICEGVSPETAIQYKAFSSLIRDKNSYLHTTGWIQSLGQGKPVDQNGDPVPWMNFPMISFLEGRLTKDLTLFEFGSGYSTQFLARRVGSIVSVEFDKKWYEMVKLTLPENAELIFAEQDRDGHYCRVVGSLGRRFDVVLIDGVDRVNCIRQSIPTLTARGVILLDDSHREKYRVGIDLAGQQGFRALGIEGLKPTGNARYRTTILYRDGNCLGL